MADVWFRKLGFSRNPFTIKPAAFSFDVVGSGIDGILSGIEDGKVLFVEAPLGYGKTTVLKGIISRYGGRRKVVYAHALNSENLDVKGLLKRSSIARFITGNLPKGMILVVDESQNIREASVAELAEFYQSGNIRSVVFFGTKYNPGSFGSLGVNGNVIRLSRPTPEQAISIVRGRVGNLPLLSNDDILAAYRKAQGSPRRLLQICEDFCRKAADGEASVQAELSELEVSGAEPEVSQSVGAVSSTARVEASVEAEPSIAKPKPKVRKARHSKPKAIQVMKPAAIAVSKPKPRVSVPRKAVRQKVSKPRHGSTKKTAVQGSSEKSPEQEGSYWGEFMGMQK